MRLYCVGEIYSQPCHHANTYTLCACICVEVIGKYVQTNKEFLEKWLLVNSCMPIKTEPNGYS